MHFIMLSIYWDKECCTQKLQIEMKAQSHLNSSGVNRSYMTHGESFTSRSVPNNVINTDLFSSVINRSYMTHGESFTSRSVPYNVINTNLYSFCSQ